MITVARITKDTWGWTLVLEGVLIFYGPEKDENGYPSADAALRDACDSARDGTPALIFMGPKEALT